MIKIFLSCVLLYSVWGALILEDREIPTVPLRVDGWLDKDPIIQKRLGSQIAMLILNPVDDTYEQLLRNHIDADAVIIRSVNEAGSAFYITDGSGTEYITLPAVEMPAAEFDLLMAEVQNHTVIADLTFTESNKFVVFDNSAGWLLLISLYVILYVGIMILSGFKLFKFGFFKDCIACSYNYKNTIVYIILSIEFISSIVKIMHGIDMNNFTLIYHHKLTRILHTIQIPFFITSHLLWAFWAHRIFEKSKRLEEITRVLGNIKLPFIILSVVLIILEIISLIGTLTFAATFPYWIMFVLVFYILCAIGISVFYTVVFARIILTFRQNGGSERAKKSARELTILVAIFDAGILLWIIMLFFQFAPLELAAKRYTSVIGIFGFIIDSYAILWSFKPRYKTDVKSSAKKTTASTKKSSVDSAMSS